MEPAAQSTASPSFSAAGGNGDSVEYRTLSVLAILSLVLGLASPLSLLAPLLLSIAFFGAAASLIALRRIASSGGLLAGRGVALVGLALCVVSIGAACGRTIMTRQLLAHQASTFAMQWFDLLQSGRAEQAYEMTTPRPLQAPETESEVAAHDGDAHSHALEQFLEDPLVKALIAVGEGAVVRWDRNLAVEFEQHGLDTFQQLYTIAPSDPGQEAFAARLTLRRAKKVGKARPSWLITVYERDDLSALPSKGS